MSGRILIIDASATNRIVLKVKMMASHFAVDACATAKDATALISHAAPDLILINLADPSEDRHEFCRQLRNSPATGTIAIIAVGGADTAAARFAALDAGADDVLPFPTNDTLLLARIRSLLRVRTAREEFVLRESTSRALGFDETPTPFGPAGRVALLTDDPSPDLLLYQKLKRGVRVDIHQHNTASVLKDATVEPVPDLFVIDASNPAQSTLFGLVSDLRARVETRWAAQLIVVPKGAPDMAAMFLDLGADDVVSADCCEGELKLRARALIERKLEQDKLRDTVRSGLKAAITDPLTGLYNRRYAEPHLAHLAEQAVATGQPFAVMMIDIDHFKSVNDTYGHSAGDGVLRQLSAMLQAGLRTVDLVARMGGEEFLIAMPATTRNQARLAADRLRHLIDGAVLAQADDGAPISVTISVGVAVSTPCATDNPAIGKICTRADQALYKAKSSGRNQVAMSKSAA
ncbi:diguanylate cyclase [Loktanella sp. Alg231-35]|uniref:diguanylate cyclase n=1 Tax=Loktanella sp. Alg231-35 TaxID=1922220 RepID=UPI000D55386F|nr:diguanylate cyclase [Loktanella sp. Alg231-35]